jgi:hypothetical protein
MLLALVAFIPVYRYFRLVFENAVNVPFQDDYDTGLKYLIDYTFHGATLPEKLRLIYSQHNEHRIVLNRIACLTDYALFGQLDFRHLVLFGNAALLFVLSLLFQASFTQVRLPQKLFYFLPVPFFLFQAQFWEFGVWATTAVSHLYVLVFALLSFYAINRSTNRPAWFVSSCVAAVVATYTIGNGLFTFLAVAPGLLLIRRYRLLGIWIAVGAITVGLYFWGYKKPGDDSPLFAVIFQSPSKFFDFFLALTGSGFSTEPADAILAGKLILALFLGLLIWGVYTKRLTANLTVLLLLTFICITCLAVAAARSKFGVTLARQPRYATLPVMLLIGLYLLGAEMVNSRYGKPALALVGLALAVYLNISSFKQYCRFAEDRRTNLCYCAALYNDNPDNAILEYAGPRSAKAMLRDAIQKGIYKLPPLTFADLKSQPQPFEASVPQPPPIGDTKIHEIPAFTLVDWMKKRLPSEATVMPGRRTIIGDVRPYSIHDYVVFYQSCAFIRGVPADEMRIQVIAQGRDRTYAFAVQRHTRTRLDAQYRSLLYRQSGFSCTIKKSDLEPGHYTLCLLLTGPNIRFLVPLNAIFEV